MAEPPEGPLGLLPDTVGTNIFQNQGSGSEMSSIFSSGSIRSDVKFNEYVFPNDLFQPGLNHSRIEIDIIGNSNVPKITHSIAMYMPPNIQVEYRANWDQQPLGGIAGASSEVLNRITQQFSNLGAGASGMINGAADFAQRLTSGASASYSSKQAINPHKALLYQGHEFRQLQVSTEMFARSPNESDRIKNIIKVLKWASHPGNIGAYGFSFPDQFMVRFFTIGGGSNVDGATPNPTKNSTTGEDAGYMFVFGPCILSSVQVTYNPSQAAFHLGTGAPVQVQLNLSFQEVFQLTKEHIGREEGGKITGGGW